MNYWKTVPFTNVSLHDQFFKPRVATNSKVSLYEQYRRFDDSGAFDNFRNIINKKKGAYSGLFFSDADIYKWIEASCCSLMIVKDLKLKAMVESTVELIIKTQEKNGYINTYFQTVEPSRKFTNFGSCHELYTGGHLILAGIAHHKTTAAKTLLNTAVRFVDYIDQIIGPGKLEAVDGHAGIETALMDLYGHTGEPRYFKLARFFINKRGRENSRLKWECGHLDQIGGEFGKPGKKNLKYYKSFKNYDGRYAQDHQPVRCQDKAVGHAVRAMYLYCGMADITGMAGDQDLIKALKRLWQHLTTRRMYITGGIGPARANEGFTEDFDLPNDTVCAETCAAVGMILWNQRMLHLTGNGRYADILELVLYNAFLVSVSLDGKKYFYNNPLRSNGTEHRQAWYECACCPPNAARILATLGSYIYSDTRDGMAVNLFIGSEVRRKINGTDITIKQETGYPWDGKVKFVFNNPEPADFIFYIRIPGWVRNYTYTINNKKAPPSVKNGYLKIKARWRPNDTVSLDFDMPVERIISHPYVSADYKMTALKRGPLIYCLEQEDNQVPVDQIILPERAFIKYEYDPALLGGMVGLEGDALIPDLAGWSRVFYMTDDNPQKFIKIKFKAVPYFAWDNRSPGAMNVWIKKT